MQGIENPCRILVPIEFILRRCTIMADFARLSVLMALSARPVRYYPGDTIGRTWNDDPCLLRLSSCAPGLQIEAKMHQGKRAPGKALGA